MSHPARETMARRLAAELEGARVVVDTDRAGPLAGALKAWEAADPAATHHLVVQDDVLLAPGALGHFRTAAEMHPHAVLAGYAHWHSKNSAAVRLGAAAGASWVEAIPEFYFPAQATLMPTAYVKEFVAHARDYAEVIKHDDFTLATYLMRNDVNGLISVPSLVEHRDVPSAAGNRYRFPLRSGCFVPDPATVHRDHAAVLTDYPLCPYFRDANADLLVRATVHGRTRWTRTHWSEYADEFPRSPDDLEAAFHEQRRPARREATGAQAIPESYLLGAWTVAYLLGLLARRARPGPRAGGTAGETSQTVLAALRTVPVSGLHNTLVEYQAVEESLDWITELTHQAYLLGLDDA